MKSFIKKILAFLRKIWTWVVSIPHDKLLHYSSEDMVASLAFAVIFLFTPFWDAFGWANLVAICFGVGKELYDAFHPEGHSVEWKDLVADLAGLVKVDIFLIVVYLGSLV